MVYTPRDGAARRRVVGGGAGSWSGRSSHWVEAVIGALAAPAPRGRVGGGGGLGIVRGDDDRIVHVAAHLNGAGHEIDHEEHILAREHRDAEVDPDAALNDEREQNGHTERAEREQQHEHDHEDGHGADHDVVLRERLLGPVGGHGVADEIAVGGVVLVHDGVDAVEQGKRLVPVRGRGKREHETMVRRALELRAGALELAAERRDLRRLRGAGALSGPVCLAV